MEVREIQDKNEWQNFTSSFEMSQFFQPVVGGGNKAAKLQKPVTPSKGVGNYALFFYINVS
ncbi:MAG: hypothetical protein NTY61_00275 [Candidatus Parcubacteria bacterium]|nr:hypothetical protein [Candidatus Parcubacteria bacterium]